MRETAGHGETDAFPSSEFPIDRPYDRVIAITRSGTTTEVVDLLRRLPGSAARPCSRPSTAHPVAAAATATIVLDFADEQSVVQTRFATSVLALWRAFLGADLEPIAAAAATELATELPAELVQREQFTFLGAGWTVGLANEAALKLREAAQAWTESYPAMEFRHGPISVVDDRSAVWFFGPLRPDSSRHLDGTGALVVQSDLDPMALLTTAQRLAVAVAERKGLDPDEPRNLTPSIVLTRRVDGTSQRRRGSRARPDAVAV